MKSSAKACFSSKMNPLKAPFKGRRCSFFRRPAILATLSIIFAAHTFASTLTTSTSFFEQNEQFDRELKSGPRWLNTIFAEDNDGILKNMESKVVDWETKEEYIKQWNLESTGIYPSVSKDEKINYLKDNALKFFDRRITSEVKKSESDSSLKKVGRVQEALKPSTEVPITSQVNLKFKAFVLQGKATVYVDNPYFLWSTDIKANGDLGVSMAKDLSALGLRTMVNYSRKAGSWEAAINKQISRSVSSSVSSVQDINNMAFTHQSDKKVEVNYSQAF